MRPVTRSRNSEPWLGAGEPGEPDPPPQPVSARTATASAPGAWIAACAAAVVQVRHTDAFDAERG